MYIKAKVEAQNDVNHDQGTVTAGIVLGTIIR